MTISSTKSYLFRDKDPIIAVFRELRNKQEMNYAMIERAGGPKAQIMWNWDYGPTIRPSNASMTAALRAMGYKTAVVNGGGTRIVTVIEERVVHRLEAPARKKRRASKKSNVVHLRPRLRVVKGGKKDKPWAGLVGPRAS